MPVDRYNFDVETRPDMNDLLTVFGPQQFLGVRGSLG